MVKRMSVRVYVTDWCGACKSALPQIRAVANKLGMRTEVVNVDRCPVNLKSACDAVNFVPHIEFNGREVSLEQLEGMAKK